MLFLFSICIDMSKQPKTVAQKLNEAFDYSVRLEARRASLSDFEILRLKRLLTGFEGNALLSSVADMLVAEIERDFEKFDSALSVFLSNNPSFDLMCSIASTSQFAFHPRAASDLMRNCFEIAPDDLEFHYGFTRVAWFSGNLQLCAEMIERRLKLGGLLMPLDTVARKASSVLENFQVPASLFEQMVHEVHSKIRYSVSHKRDVSIELNLDVEEHEDGSNNIVLEIFSDQDEDSLDLLDEEMSGLISDVEKWGYDLPRIMSILVRDAIPDLADEGGELA
ncbi:hypothetical protein HVE01_16170 [Vreelandella venusta]|nr:hypothetical protein HVE01_16170 [Halomonas venusta]